MVQVSIRELRHKGGEIVDRAASEEQVTTIGDGKAVAELRSAPRSPLSADALLCRARALPAVDPRRLRRDLDALLDTSR